MEVAERVRQERILGLPASVREERIQLIQTYWKALNSGDLKTFETLLAPDAVIHYPGQHYMSGDYRTTADIVNLYRQLTEFIKDGVFSGEVLDIMVGEIYTAVVLRYTITMPHKTIPGRAIGLFIIEKGKIKEYWLHEWDQVMINGIFRLSRIFKPFAKFFKRSSPHPS